MVAIFDTNLKVENFVYPCYHVAEYKRAYEHFCNPMDGANMWPKQGLPVLHPPRYHKQPRRPKTLRRREPDEQSRNVSKLKRNYLAIKCRACDQEGHNERTCKSWRSSN